MEHVDRRQRHATRQHLLTVSDYAADASQAAATISSGIRDPAAVQQETRGIQQSLIAALAELCLAMNADPQSLAEQITARFTRQVAVLAEDPTALMRTHAVRPEQFVKAAASAAADKLTAARNTLVAGDVFQHADQTEQALVDALALLCIAMGYDPAEFTAKITNRLPATIDQEQQHLS